MPNTRPATRSSIGRNKVPSFAAIDQAALKSYTTAKLDKKKIRPTTAFRTVSRAQKTDVQFIPRGDEGTKTSLETYGSHKIVIKKTAIPKLDVPSIDCYYYKDARLNTEVTLDAQQSHKELKKKRASEIRMEYLLQKRHPRGINGTDVVNETPAY